MKKVFEEVLINIRQNGYCYLKDLLSLTDLNRINDEFDILKESFTPAKIGHPSLVDRIESVRGDYTYWLDPLSPGQSYLEIFNFLDHLKKHLNQNFFLGLKDYECHLAFYPPASVYKKHLDKFEKDSSRKLSFVFYLNRSWEEGDGGEIVLYNLNGKILDIFYPYPGAFLCFLSDEFPHEVKASRRERRSLTGWMHNKIIY